jgi:hypothetical protein
MTQSIAAIPKEDPLRRDLRFLDGEVLTSDHGLRVVPLLRWHGSRRELIDRDPEFVREALAAHPGFADTRAVEARIFDAARRA